MFKINFRFLKKAAYLTIVPALILFLNFSAGAQGRDSVKTGYLLDAAEEYWPQSTDTNRKGKFFDNINHVPIRNTKGFISLGGSVRAVYENFDKYLWGLGPQDPNGYFLERILLHADLRYNKHFRLFGELESSFVINRNGGPRPVQDLNKFDPTQLFAEYSTGSGDQLHYKIRIGEQALNYGLGTLLDIRDANVRRSFAGAKLILEKNNSRLDIFAMQLVQTKNNWLDDYVDHGQKIAGFWLTSNVKNPVIQKFEVYYIYIERGLTQFSQGPGRERRHTLGASTTLKSGSWSTYSEADLQLGKFNEGNIRAWKVTQGISYEITNLKTKPVFTFQTAMSSGDKNPADKNLETFNPIYPKAIYYGFVDNSGSSNIFLIHGKAELSISKKTRMTAGYYRFWRQSLKDGIYGPSGFPVLPPANNERLIGDMFDLTTSYGFSPHLRITAIVADYTRGGFLTNIPAAYHDILYGGLNLSLHF
ncbi:alginate export family protein [Mucilaginibacter gilvus]|uniref:Alginate export domain-containing protein n=1 Tax=Mucilaginibacter gilvus TaxID=2305909 RepID=A0A3S4Y4N8_9SPHI|nr:alginate export family protein [Mucilaginibacter gilvus]RWY47360.1 hypothetical protein EPL05_21940 [Mucilaginibacter gilvus]